MTNAWLLVGVALAAWAIASFLLARKAEARAVKHPPSVSRFAIASAASAIGCAMLFRSTPAGSAACGIACIALIAAADSDVRTGLLFDAVTVPAAILTWLAACIAGTAFEAVFGVALLASSFGAIVFFSRGRMMGLGDVKAMVAIGAAFGPLESLIAIFAACVSGLAAAAIGGRMKRGARLCFGPHLAVGAMFSLIAGDPIVHRWMGL